MVEKLPEWLENISELSLVTANQEIVGTVTYDEQTHEVIGKLSTADGVLRSEDLHLNFKATIQPMTPAETLIKVKGQAEATYTDGMIAAPVTSNEVVSQVIGQLLLINAPREIEFGTVAINDFQKTRSVDREDISTPLVVEDSRKNKQQWYLTAQVQQEMTNGKDIQKGALKYIYQRSTIPLTAEPQLIYLNNRQSNENFYNISDTWKKTDTGEGLKLQIVSGVVPKTSGSYQGIIRWTLNETIE